MLELRAPHQAVNGVLLRAGIVAAPICGQRDGLARDGCGDRLAVGRKLAANAVGEGQQNRSANLEDLIAELVVALVQQLLRFRQRRRIQQIDLALAGK